LCRYSQESGEGAVRHAAPDMTTNDACA
jgi:hypothetical protein